MSQKEGREREYLLKMVGSLGERVERVDVILGENNKRVHWKTLASSCFLFWLFELGSVSAHPLQLR